MWNSLSGYVMIRLDGLGLERLLNRMLQAGMPVWNVRREGRTRMTAEIRAKDFLRLRALKKGARCRIHIVERHGVPFVLARFRFRKLLLAGAVLCFIAILAAQTRVWLIRVDGCSRVPEAVVLRALTAAEAGVGMPREQVKMSVLGQAVRAYDDRIAWAGVRLEGITLHVQVVEAEPIPERPDKSVPADVVARKDAIIERVTALSGKSSVSPGDAVRAGDILIRGDITREGGAQRVLVYAEGEVIAQVWYTESITLPCTQERLIRSGRNRFLPHAVPCGAARISFRAGICGIRNGGYRRGGRNGADTACPAGHRHLLRAYDAAGASAKRRSACGGIIPCGASSAGCRTQGSAHTEEEK